MVEWSDVPWYVKLATGAMTVLAVGSVIFVFGWGRLWGKK